MRTYRVAIMVQQNRLEQILIVAHRAATRRAKDRKSWVSPSQPVISSHQFAHAPKSKVDKAYDRAKFLGQGTKMMQNWANYLIKYN